MKKKIFYTEAAYIGGILLLALGTAMTEFGDFGISMVVAPAYLLHLKVSELLPFFSFGMAEYVFQTVILIGMMILLRKVRGVYFLSIVTAIIYGCVLDAAVMLVSLISYNGLPIRIVLYIFGVLISSAGIALFFHTYLPPEVYEMFVKEISTKYHIKLHVFKIIYDCCSLVLAIGMSLVFFGNFKGIGIGTIACAFLNGMLIRLFSNLFERKWVFNDYFKTRKIFKERGEIL